ncbi:TIGR02302 family protein [Cribrihabitans pelagius]|uniref:TIGR02302 family protein n=1 Tax=Cribrihabitans pelagius TaxID=1765746 RepID=UPI003B5927C8
MDRTTARNLGIGDALKRLRRPLALTRAGMAAERSLRAFWPLVSVLMAALAALMLGLHELLPVEAVWTGTVATVLGALAALGWGLWRFRWPSRAAALARLDETLPGRPVSTLLDQQAIGADDPASAALWQAHRRRMAEAARRARAPAPDLKLAAADPFALRYVAALALVVALLFGSFWQVASVRGIAPGGNGTALGGPAWEGWAEPPAYTRLPVLYLNDQAAGPLELPAGSAVTLRFYGKTGALTLAETVSGRAGEVRPAAAPMHEFEAARSGTLEIAGPGGRSWQVAVIPDQPPKAAAAGDPELDAGGETAIAYSASDDYGVAGGTLTITLDLAGAERRHGLIIDPDARDHIVVDLPLPISGSRKAFTETLIEDFAQHPWANLPVTYRFTVRDEAGQDFTAPAYNAPLVARRFFDPLAAAVAEQRRDLLWSRANAPRVARILRSLSHRPEGVFRDYGDYLRLRSILRRLEGYISEHSLPAPRQEEVAAALWDLALQMEEGDMGDALERMQRAQERLSQAMRDGASDQEIARLMQELREATQDYLRQLSRQAEAGPEQPGGGDQNTMTLSQDDLQAMMDRIQELMEQGRMAEAEQALREFQQMMENMRVTRSQGGQGGDAGREAMEGLAETLREQQGLSDQAFRDLQEQFNPGAQSGESQGNEGREGGLGRGQSHQDGGQQGTGRGSDAGRGEGGSRQNRGPDGSFQEPDAGSLADRQEALRRQLQRQQQGLPFAGGEAGDAAREALDRAGRAMDGAEDALRGGDLADAIGRQSEAMEALREGMRSLGEALAQQQQGQPNGQGQPSATARGDRMDPLGRSSRGTLDGGEVGEGQAYRRAWDLLEEIRRRAGDRERGDSERGYLQRLLDRF